MSVIGFLPPIYKRALDGKNLAGHVAISCQDRVLRPCARRACMISARAGWASTPTPLMHPSHTKLHQMHTKTHVVRFKMHEVALRRHAGLILQGELAGKVSTLDPHESFDFCGSLKEIKTACPANAVALIADLFNGTPPFLLPGYVTVHKRNS